MSVGVHAARDRRCGRRPRGGIAAVEGTPRASAGVARALRGRGPAPRILVCALERRGPVRPRARLGRRPGQRSPHGRARGTVRPRSRCRSPRPRRPPPPRASRGAAAPMPGGEVAARSRGGDCSSEADDAVDQVGHRIGRADPHRGASRAGAVGEGPAHAQPSTCESTSIRRRPPTSSPSIRADSTSCARSQFIAATLGRVPPPHLPLRTSSSAIAAQALGGPGTCGFSPFPCDREHVGGFPIAEPEHLDEQERLLGARGRESRRNASSIFCRRVGDDVYPFYAGRRNAF